MNLNNFPVVVETDHAGPFTHLFHCEACKCAHGFNVSLPDLPVWSYNGNAQRPTVSPSILVRWERPQGDLICHSFITEGRIQYLSDCTHQYAGETLPLLPVDDIPIDALNYPPDWQ